MVRSSVAHPSASSLTALERRFEAVVLDWDGTGVPDRSADATSLRDIVERLSVLGLHVAVITGTHVGNVDGQLRARPAGPGALHLLLNRGSEVFAVDPDGPRIVYRREATAEENRALDASAALTVERLAARGLRAEIVSERLNRRKIDVIPEPEWADPPKARIDELLRAVEERLHAAGIEDLREVVALAAQAAAEAGLGDPRVTSDAKHVEIGLTDKSDSARWIFNEYRRRGIGPSHVLVAGDEFGPLGGMRGSDSLMMVAEGAGAVVVSVGVEPSGVPRGVLPLGGGPEAFLAILEEQARRRERGAVPEADGDPGWSLEIRGFDPERERAREAILSLADGCIGTSGAPPARHVAATPGVLAAGLYTGEGPDSHLAPCPVWHLLPLDLAEGTGLRRILDLRSGMLHQELTLNGDALRTAAFSSLARPGVACFRAEGAPVFLPPGPALIPSFDGGSPIEWPDGARKTIGYRALPKGMVVAAADEARRNGSRLNGLERIAAYHVDLEDEAPPDAARRRLEEAQAAGYERLLDEHRSAWSSRWEEADIEIDGDPELQLAVRVALFHLMASVPDRGDAAVGARGLSGPGYRGHVFWDADVFVVPFMAATHPAAARAVLEYRVRRLPAARALAKALGRAGARFPWESARDGLDVTPRAGRDLSGRVFPIRTGQLEEHIVADVAWGAACYIDWTGDAEFASGPGADILIETARYWTSRVRMGSDGRAHMYGVIGPDEYHEPVDDNAFTNVMARWNLRRAAAAASGRDDVTDVEIGRWLETAELLSDNYHPDTGLYEQCAGFWKLESLIVADVAPRRPIAAELLLGRDRVRNAQVIKQADTLMMHHLVPGEVAPGSLVPNLDFYEPRTAHGSSLSPGVHAALFARAGRLDAALKWLTLASRVDLDDLTATSSAGLHIATMGSVWQALVFGFAGARAEREYLAVDPRIPPAWNRYTIRLAFRGSRVRIDVDHASATVRAEPMITVRIGADGPSFTAGPSGTTCERVGSVWRVRT